MNCQYGSLILDMQLKIFPLSQGPIFCLFHNFLVFFFCSSRT
jgi:hypothetical protein